MAIKTKTELKDDIAGNKLTSQLLIDIVDSMSTGGLSGTYDANPRTNDTGIISNLSMGEEAVYHVINNSQVRVNGVISYNSIASGQTALVVLDKPVPSDLTRSFQVKGGSSYFINVENVYASKFFENGEFFPSIQFRTTSIGSFRSLPFEFFYEIE